LIVNYGIAKYVGQPVLERVIVIYPYTQQQVSWICLGFLELRRFQVF
jgi:hypothetical protein